MRGGGNVAFSHLEDLIVAWGAFQDFVEMLAVGVGDEDLSEGIAGDEVDNLFDTLGIEFVEDVVEEEQGSGFASCAFEKVELGEFQGDDVGLVLPLGTFTFDGIASEGHLQFVFVDAMQGITHDAVFDTVTLDDVEQVTSLTMTGVVE